MNFDNLDIILDIAHKAILYLRDNWLSIAAFILSVTSLSITWRKNITDRQYANDKELLEQLKQSLELAYKSIAPSKNDGPPTNHRLRWLTAARHIARYRELKLKLKTQLYETICEEQEEYWRYKIYSLLARIEDSHFFESVNPEKVAEEEIDMRSAAVVYSFSVWKEDRSDPLNNMSLEEIIQKYELYSPLHMNFWEYVKRKKPELAKRIKP